MGKNIRIAYICDGLDVCSDRVGCYRHAKSTMDFCWHTSDPRHAANGAVEDPSLYPERFHKLDIPNDTSIDYWEGDIDIP